MPLKLPPAPEGTLQIVASALDRAHRSGRFALASGTPGAAVVVTPVAPHQVFAVGLNQLVQGRRLEVAKLVAWRTIILQGKKPVAAVEFTGDGSSPLRFKAVNEGPFVESTAAAISVAETLPQVREHDFELRLLQITGINLLSLWLHSSNEDLFIPLAPTPGVSRAYTPYTETEFFGMVIGLATQRNQGDDD
jgi:hypothetical protein